MNRLLIAVLLLAASTVSSRSDNRCGELRHLKRGYRATTDDEYSTQHKEDHDEGHDVACRPTKQPPAESSSTGSGYSSLSASPVGGYDGVQQGTTVDTSVYPSSPPLQSNLHTSNPYALSPALTSYGGFSLYPSANSFMSPNTGNFLLGSTVVVSKTRPAVDVTRAYSRNKASASKPSVTTQDFSSFFQPNNQLYSPYTPLYNPSSQQLSFANPTSYAFKSSNYLQPGYQMNYGFGNTGILPTLQTPTLQHQTANTGGDKNAASTNHNALYPGLQPSFATANPFTYGASFASPYGGNLLNGNTFPMLTAHGFQASPNNLVSSAAVSAPFSSGIYHSQPPYVNQFLAQKKLPAAGVVGKFQPQSVSITTARPRVPLVTERPDEASSSGGRHNYEEDSKYKYDPEDDDHYEESEPSSDYNREGSYRHHDDDDDEEEEDSSEGSSETSSGSSFPVKEEFLKTSQSVGKSSYDQESGPDNPRGFAVEDIFKTSPKEYYSSSFHSEDPFSFPEPTRGHESREKKTEYKYRYKKPSDHDKKTYSYGKQRSYRPGAVRSYNSKRAASYDEESYPLGRYGEPYYDDSEAGHSEYSPQSLGQEVTQEDKKRDYYSYSVVTHKLSD